MDEQKNIVVHTCKGMLFTFKKGENPATFSKNEPRGHNTFWKRPVSRVALLL